MIDRKSVDIKFGLQLPVTVDFRTIPFRSLLRLGLLPPLPDSFDVDADLGGVPDDNMFGNDVYGDCVKAAFAHMLLRLEKFEQGIIIPITADEVIADYLRESGGQDTGLVLTYAMKDWRNTGITVGGKTYTIDAFAGVNQADHTQVKYSIYLLRGLIFAMQVYSTDVDQWRAGQPWHLTGHNGTFEGGHGVYAKSYITAKHDCPHCPTGWIEDRLSCITWATEQPMDWDFWDQRIIQTYAIVDNKDKWLGANSPLDMQLMRSWLKEVTGQDPYGNGCCVSRFIKEKILR
jgi:hypothetical protein